MKEKKNQLNFGLASLRLAKKLEVGNVLLLSQEYTLSQNFLKNGRMKNFIKNF